MTRNVFYSFHYKPDGARASQVRNAGVLDGNQPCSDNDWETITDQGDCAIEDWIDGQMSGRSCALVLIGAATAGRKWINYEIKKAWNGNKGLVGVYVHHLKDLNQSQSTKGSNPFALSRLVKLDSRQSLRHTTRPTRTARTCMGTSRTTLLSWVETAIQIRANH